MTYFTSATSVELRKIRAGLTPSANPVEYRALSARIYYLENKEKYHKRLYAWREKNKLKHRYMRQSGELSKPKYRKRATIRMSYKRI